MAARGVPSYMLPAQPQAAAPQAAVAGGPIAGQLPWGAGAGNMFQGLGGDPATTLANLGANYQNAYGASLAQNQANYGNILTGYQQTMGAQQAGQAATQAGYGQLSADVLGGISGIGSDQQALLDRQYAQQRGRAMQGLINSGLGNSTVTSSVNRGIGLDEALAGNNLANSIAQTRAGYQSQLGQAGLSYQGQSVRDNANLAGRQLDWMNSVNSGYPDAGMYGTLAQQAGAAIQAGLNRDQIDRLAAQNAASAAGIRQQGVLGGSGGTAPSSGGRLPPSSINWGTGSGGSTGAGSGGGYGGSDPFRSGTAGNAPRTGTGVTGAGSGWATGYAGDFGADAFAGAFDAFDQGDGFVGPEYDYGWGIDQIGQGAAAGFGAALPAGGGYDPWSNPFGFGGDFTTDWGGGLDQGYNPNEYMPASFEGSFGGAYDVGAGAFGSAFPSYDYTPAASAGYDAFAGALDGMSDYWGEW
jgi:hypothetical protein